jgi:RNA polymerase sigma-70 factor (ECF subfamily)
MRNEEHGRADWVTAAVLHERYLDDVFRYVSRRVARREDAEDITAEVFAAAFIELPRYRGESPPYLWLLGIARRKIVDSLRRRSSRPEMLASELPEFVEVGEDSGRASSEDDPQAAALRRERQRAIRELVSQLKPEQQEALLLQYVESLSIAEIAIVMGRSEGAVNSLLQRARAGLYRRGRAYFLGDEEKRR